MKHANTLSNPLPQKTWDPNYEPWLNEYEYCMETLALQKSYERMLQNGSGKEVNL